MTPRQVLVFGASGGLGKVIAERFEADGEVVIRSSRKPIDGYLCIDPFGDAGIDNLTQAGNLDVVVWAQGSNVNDSVGKLDLLEHHQLIEANYFFISHTLDAILRNGQLSNGSHLCVLSSIWQEIARQDKFSYTVSKAAVAGLVRSASVDLAGQGILVNAVLPGVVDTEMTRTVLTAEQTDRFKQATGFGRLVSPTDVANAVWFLCSSLNNGITGQSLAVDLGYSVGRTI